jgi:glutaredoxin
MNDIFKPRVYLKSSCPFCFKFLLFLTEAGILQQFEIISIAADNAEEMARYRRLLEEKAGQAIFPTVEIAPDTYMDDSDELIDHYTKEYAIDMGGLPTYAFYMNGPFPRSLDLFRENLALKKQLAETC